MPGDALSEAATAGVASALSKLSTYPFDLLKARMATSEKSQGLVEALELIVKQDGVLGLYKGSGPRVTKSVTGKVLYFYLYRTLTDMAVGDNPRPLTALENIVVGYFSDIFGLPLVMPLDAIATRIQLTKTPTSFIQVAQDLHKEGRLYVSWEAYVLGAMQPAIQNTIFDQLKAQMFKNRSLSVLESFVLGVVAASISLTLTYPLDYARTVSQSASKKSSAKPKVKLVVCHEDPKECSKLAETHDLLHLNPTLLEKALLSSPTPLGRRARWEYSMRGSLERSVIEESALDLIFNEDIPEASSKRGYLLEGVSPKRIKSSTAMQDDALLIIDQPSNKDLEHLAKSSSSKPSVASILRDTVAREGFGGMFKGLSANLMQGVLSAALMLMIKEKLALIVAKFILRVKRLLGLA